MPTSFLYIKRTLNIKIDNLICCEKSPPAYNGPEECKQFVFPWYRGITNSIVL